MYRISTPNHPPPHDPFCRYCERERNPLWPHWAEYLRSTTPIIIIMYFFLPLYVFLMITRKDISNLFSRTHSSWIAQGAPRRPRHPAFAPLNHETFMSSGIPSTVPKVPSCVQTNTFIIMIRSKGRQKTRAFYGSMNTVKIGAELCRQFCLWIFGGGPMTLNLWSIALPGTQGQTPPSQQHVYEPNTLSQQHALQHIRIIHNNGLWNFLLGIHNSIQHYFILC